MLDSDSTGPQIRYAATQLGIVRLQYNEAQLLGLSCRDIAAALSEVGWSALQQAQVKRILEASELQLIAPFNTARKLVVVGLNFAADEAERQRRREQDPILVIAPGSAIAGPGGVTRIAAAAGSQVIPEGEIGVVIGSIANDIAVAEAWKFVAGLTLVNDLTAVDLMRRGFSNPLFNLALGKSFPGFKPAGPYLVPAECFSPDYDLEIVTTVNEVVIQQGQTRDYAFSASEIISFASRYCTLEPGDIVSMGLPAAPVRPEALRALEPGDIIEVRVSELGTLRTQMTATAS